MKRLDSKVIQILYSWKVSHLRLFFSWLKRFFSKLAFILLWTLIVGMFVVRYGISNLPFLFLFSALFTIVGSLVFGRLLMAFRAARVLNWTVVFAGALLFLAVWMQHVSQLAFLFLLLFVQTVLFVQIRMLLFTEIEENFNPLESEKAYPLIETAETVAGLLAGLFVYRLAEDIFAYKFIYLVIVLIFSLIPLAFYSEKYFRHHFEETELIKHHKFFDFSRFKSIPSYGKMLLGVGALVFFQWMIANLIEFTYLLEIYNSVSGKILESGSGFEHSFIHEIGQLTMFFYGCSFVAQLIGVRKIINSLGVSGGLVFHGAFMFLTILFFIFADGFLASVILKNNFLISSIVFINAFHITFYALMPADRELFREFFEGILKPLGALCGTVLLLVFQFMLSAEVAYFAATASLLVLVVLYLWIAISEKRNYQSFVDKMLRSNLNVENKIEYLMLSFQRGVNLNFDGLRQILFSSGEDVRLKKLILKFIASHPTADGIKLIIDFFRSQSHFNEVFIETFLKHSSEVLAYLRQEKGIEFNSELLSLIENFSTRHFNSKLLAKICNFQIRLGDLSRLKVLVRNAKIGTDDEKIFAFQALAGFKCSEVAAVAKNFSGSEFAVGRLKFAALSYLYSLDDFKSFVCGELVNILASEDREDIVAALDLIGRLQIFGLKNLVLRINHLNDARIKIAITAALIRLRFHSVPLIVRDFFVHESILVKKQFLKVVKNLDVQNYQKIAKMLKYNNLT